LKQLKTEAQQLAEIAGDEDETLAYLCWRACSRNSMIAMTLSISQRNKKNALAAIEYFQRKGDWTSFSEACDGYAALALNVGAYQDALEMSRRRLSVPDLPALETAMRYR